MEVTIEKPRNCAHCPWLNHEYEWGEFRCGYDDADFRIFEVDLYVESESNERCPLGKET